MFCTQKSNTARGIIAVIVALIIAGGVFAYIAFGPSRAFAVTLPISAESLDASGSSKVPVRVVGTTARGESVDKVYYFSSDSSDCKLEEGTYTFTVAGSPVAADGTIYSVESTPLMGTLSSDGSLALTGGTDGALALTPIAAAEVSDDQIDLAYSFLKLGGAASEEQADELKNIATQRRDNALVQKAADGSADAQATTDEAEGAENAAGVSALVGNWFYATLAGGARSSMQIDASGTATITDWSSGTGQTWYHTYAITANSDGTYTFTATSDGTTYTMRLNGDMLEGDFNTYSRVP